MTPPSIAVIAATLLTADLGWQQQFRNAARRTRLAPNSLLRQTDYRSTELKCFRHREESSRGARLVNLLLEHPAPGRRKMALQTLGQPQKLTLGIGEVILEETGPVFLKTVGANERVVPF
jgi:hypothetical protein